MVSDGLLLLCGWRKRASDALFSFPVDFSSAETLSMPFASMSKVTSIWGRRAASAGCRRG